MWLGSGIPWLWHGLAAAPLIGHLAWELLYAACVALKVKKKKEEEEESEESDDDMGLGLFD